MARPTLLIKGCLGAENEIQELLIITAPVVLDHLSVLEMPQLQDQPKDRGSHRVSCYSQAPSTACGLTVSQDKEGKGRKET